MHTCSALDNYYKLDAIGFEQSPPVLLMVMCMSEVPPRSIKQSEVVSEIDENDDYILILFSIILVLSVNGHSYHGMRFQIYVSVFYSRCCWEFNLLGKAIFHEVPVKVTDPLDMDGHHPSADCQLCVVAPCSCHHVAYDEEESFIRQTWGLFLDSWHLIWKCCTSKCQDPRSCKHKLFLACCFDDICNEKWNQFSYQWVSFQTVSTNGTLRQRKVWKLNTWINCRY